MTSEATPFLQNRAKTKCNKHVGLSTNLKGPTSVDEHSCYARHLRKKFKQWCSLEEADIGTRGPDKTRQDGTSHFRRTGKSSHLPHLRTLLNRPCSKVFSSHQPNQRAPLNISGKRSDTTHRQDGLYVGTVQTSVSTDLEIWGDFHAALCCLHYPE